MRGYKGCLSWGGSRTAKQSAGEWPEGESWAGAASTKWEHGAEPSRTHRACQGVHGDRTAWKYSNPTQDIHGHALKLALLEQEPPVLPPRRAQAARAGTQPQATLLSSHTAAFFWEVTVPTFCCLNPDFSPISHPCVLCLPPSQGQRSCCPALQLSGRTHQSPPQGEKAKALHIHQFGWFKRKVICF